MRAQLGTVVNCLLPHSGRGRCYGTDVTYSTDSGLWRNGSPETGTCAFSRRRSGRCLATCGPADVVGQQKNDEAEKEEAIPRGAMWMAEFPHFVPGTPWPRVAGSPPSAPPSPVDLVGSVVRTLARVFLALLTGHKPASPHVGLSVPRTRPGHHQDMAGKKKSPGRRVTASGGDGTPGQARQPGEGPRTH